MLRWGPFGRIRASAVPPLLPLLSPPFERARDEPIGVIWPASAATYIIEGTIDGEARELTLGIDRLPLWTWDVSHRRGIWRETFTMPSEVRTPAAPLR